jgi:hypothetical protein
MMMMVMVMMYGCKYAWAFPWVKQVFGVNVIYVEMRLCQDKRNGDGVFERAGMCIYI